MTEPFNNPFAKLKGTLPEAPRPEQAAAPKQAAPPAEPAVKGPARAVVRLEKKGRGGKEVTVVEKLGLPPKERDVWMKELKQALGTGGQVEGEDLVLNGDQRERLKKLLPTRGVRKVTIG